MPDQCPAVSGGPNSIRCTEKRGHKPFSNDVWAWEHQAKGRKW